MTEVRRIGLGIRISSTFFKVFVTIKHNLQKKKRITLKSSYFGLKLGKIANP